MREITLMFGSPDSLSMMPSVMPSLRYSMDGSALELVKGSTAIESIVWLFLAQKK